MTGVLSRSNQQSQAGTRDQLERSAATQGSLGFWTGLTPDDSPLALRDISTFEIYALDWHLP